MNFFYCLQVNYAVVRNDTDNFEADLEEQVCVISKGKKITASVILLHCTFLVNTISL